MNNGAHEMRQDEAELEAEQKLFVAKEKRTHLYVAQGAGTWGRLEKDKNAAMKKPKSWWLENLSRTALSDFVLEEA